MDEIQQMLEAFALKQQNIVDEELRKIPTSALPNFIAAFESVAKLAKLELEFRKLKEKIN